MWSCNCRNSAQVCPHFDCTSRGGTGSRSQKFLRLKDVSEIIPWYYHSMIGTFTSATQSTGSQTCSTDVWVFPAARVRRETQCKALFSLSKYRCSRNSKRLLGSRHRTWVLQVRPHPLVLSAWFHKILPPKAYLTNIGLLGKHIMAPVKHYHQEFGWQWERCVEWQVVCSVLILFLQVGRPTTQITAEYNKRLHPSGDNTPRKKQMKYVSDRRNHQGDMYMSEHPTHLRLWIQVLPNWRL